MLRFLKRITGLVAKQLLWFALWIFTAIAISLLIDLTLWPVPDGSEEWGDMWPTLLSRVMSYLILFYGQIVIAKTSLLFDTKYAASKFQGLQLGIIFSEGRNGYLRYKQSMRRENNLKYKVGLWVIGIAVVWTVVWSYLSVSVFFVCCSHFMGDQDAGDLPMWLDSIYPSVLYWITIGISFVIFTAINGMLLADMQSKSLK
jgi:hypothetical protein